MLSRNISLMFLLLVTCHVSAESDGDLSDLQQQCKRISDRLASVSYERCISHNFDISEGQSVKGLPILIKRFNPDSNSDRTKESKHQRVLLVGGIHGDEYSSVSIIFKWITLLHQYYTGTYHWQIVPLLNADGLLQKSSTRVNANGVDLDRNFPTDTKQMSANQYWQENTHWNPEYFPGKEALSEPETRWLVKEIEHYNPDAIITVHAPYIKNKFRLPENNQVKIGGQYQKTITTHPGSLNQYVGNKLNIPILTIELPYSDVMPTNVEVSEMWKNLVKWLNEQPESS